MKDILTKRPLRVKQLLGTLTTLLGAALFLGGCLPPLPPEADRPPDPGVVVSPEQHRGRAQIFALENYDQLQLFARSARKRNNRWVFDRQGIRFEEQKGEVTLVMTGRYFWKFDAQKTTAQEEAEELWRRIIAPFLEEMFLKNRRSVPGMVEGIFLETGFKLGFERMLVEVRFERENSAVKNITQEALGRFNIKLFGAETTIKPESPQNFVSRTEILIDDKPVVLRADILGEEPAY